MMKKYKFYFKDRSFLLSAFFALILLVGSLFANYYAGTYATERESNAVTDIILSNIRVYDIDGIFVYGAIVFWTFIWGLCLVYPNKLPFTIKTIALFILIRSVFVSLTHIGPFPSQAAIESNLISYFSFGGDLFFSGHTGIPFLMALVFWNDFRLRILFIATSVLFAVVVLLAHLHYSIDVLSAFFITYTIVHIAEVIFKKDRQLFFSVME